MKTLTEVLNEQFGDAFVKAGYDRAYGDVAPSSRPDLGHFQVNGALPAAKKTGLNPRAIAESVIALVETGPAADRFAELTLAGPGFINIRLADGFLAQFASQVAADERLGSVPVASPLRVVIDFGGANVAKDMHVGHLRSSVIGDSLRRIFAFRGDDVISDIHLGDWGTQMGQLLMEIERTQPDLPYFDPTHFGPYPEESPVTMADFAELYPRASARFKEDPQAAAVARQATKELQDGRPGYRALWRHMLATSVTALQADSNQLGIHFDHWKGESDAHEYIEAMIEELVANGYAINSQGALVIDVAEASDKKDVVPLILTKSDGAVLYGTTDLATIVQRVRDFDPDLILYVVDQRQALHFLQVFRAAKKTGLAGKAQLEHLGFGTMNGPDGRPFKTRKGNAMMLKDLMALVYDEALERLEDIEASANYDEAERSEIARLVALAALKFGDLINQRTKDYRFDLERFTAFEGRTGPYLLYTAVRTKSILRRAVEDGLQPGPFQPPRGDEERDLILALLQFPDWLKLAYDTRLPNHLCEYAYSLAMTFNRFYRANHILSETDEAQQGSWLSLLEYFLRVLEQALDLLGIATPERM